MIDVPMSQPIANVAPILPPARRWVVGLAALILAGSSALAAPAPVHAGAPPDRAICQTPSPSMQQLAEILNTRDSNIQCLGVTLDGASIKALRVETHRFVPVGDAAISDHVKVAEFSVAQIESPRGAVLDGAPGHDAVILQGHVSSDEGNVDLVTSYLYNGLTGEYRSCTMRLGRDRAAAWRLVNRFNEIVSRIVVRTRSLPALGVIGIADLEGICSR
jgi:hypothetical protein